MKQAIKSKTFCIQFVVTNISWFGNNFVYDGLSFSIGSLGGNPFVNYAIGSSVEFIGVFASHYALDKFGRKYSYCLFLVFGGLALISIGFVPSRNYSIYGYQEFYDQR